ncbi:hypothetical protein EDC01DRAFT_478249 [Geopyxis carbonaria]|nr:hypothetical protein EDC01DRAFT_478249 [Geopyxis carbonaria]
MPLRTSLMMHLIRRPGFVSVSLAAQIPGHGVCLFADVQTTVPIVQHKNGTSERMIQNLVMKGRCMILGTLISPTRETQKTIPSYDGKSRILTTSLEFASCRPHSMDDCVDIHPLEPAPD